MRLVDERDEAAARRLEAHRGAVLARQLGGRRGQRRDRDERAVDAPLAARRARDDEAAHARGAARLEHALAGEVDDLDLDARGGETVRERHGRGRAVDDDDARARRGTGRTPQWNASRPQARAEMMPGRSLSTKGRF